MTADATHEERRRLIVRQVFNILAGNSHNRVLPSTGLPWGVASSVARMINVNVTTIRAWVITGNIPRSWHPVLLAAARKHGRKLRQAHFFEIDPVPKPRPLPAAPAPDPRPLPEMLEAPAPNPQPLQEMLEATPMDESELRHIAWVLASAAERPGGCEPMVSALHRLLMAADGVLHEAGIVLSYQRVLPSSGDGGS